MNTHALAPKGKPTFTKVQFPKQVPSPRISPRHPSRNSVGHLVPPRVGGSQLPTILVVEDDASVSQAIERVLRAGGFVAVPFVSAEAALEAGAVAAADGLVLDIHLPGMSGFELYRQLAGAGKPTPAIFITARDEPATRNEAEGLGGAGSYLPKPFSGRNLLDAVSLALRRH